MAKLGVGIGDEFPIDDGKPAGENASSGPGFNPNDPDYEARRTEYFRQREAWRAQRAAFREQRRQWREKLRAEWRERKHAFKEEMRARYGDDFDDYGYGHGGDHRHWRGHHLFRILFLVGLLVIGITIFSHIYILFGLAVLVGLWLAYRGGWDGFDYIPAGHYPPPPAPPAPPAPSQTPPEEKA